MSTEARIALDLARLIVGHRYAELAHLAYRRDDQVEAGSHARDVAFQLLPAIGISWRYVVAAKMTVELRDDVQELVPFFFGHSVSLAAEDDRRAHAAAQLVVVD